MGMGREPIWGAETEKNRAREERALAAERDRQVRLRSVATDTRLNLPVSVPNPAGEELPRRSQRQAATSYNQRDEIVKSCCVQGPPNKTICNVPDWAESDKYVPDQHRSSSTGQLGWVSKWNSSGKSPPSHKSSSRGQRQPHSTKAGGSTSGSPLRGSSKHKGSISSSSSCSSSSSLSNAGLGFMSGPINTLTSKSESSGGIHSFTEKLHTVFSPSAAGQRTSPNNNTPSSSGVFSSLFTETRQRSKSYSKGGGNRRDTKSAAKHSDFFETANQSSPKNKSLPSNAASLEVGHCVETSDTLHAGNPDASTRRTQSDGLFVMVGRNPSGASQPGLHAISKEVQPLSEDWNYAFGDSTTRKTPPLSSSSPLKSDSAVHKDRHLYNVSGSRSPSNVNEWISPNTTESDGPDNLQPKASSDCLRKQFISLTSDKSNEHKNIEGKVEEVSSPMSSSGSSPSSSSSPLLESASNPANLHKSKHSENNEQDKSITGTPPNSSSFNT